MWENPRASHRDCSIVLILRGSSNFDSIVAIYPTNTNPKSVVPVLEQTVRLRR
jgi:hypothetical protein